ncbi:MAG: hypothetical protein DMF69_06455 [Acidobacteria bacterium]|nr:MAG: hypothetical protein DMF69_06455 [Acidobacteriota bacterium]
MNKCRVCGNESGNSIHVAKELQLGLGDEFQYLECSKCGCLQILEIPADLWRYYPKHYYSYRSASATLDYSKSGLTGFKQRFLLHALTNYYFGKKGFFGKWLAGRSILSRDFPLWVRRQRLSLDLRKDSLILDVGCGKGQLLLDMHAYGFTNLRGIDPFLDADVFYDNGVKIYKKAVENMEGKFDFIMLNHSFEHMPNQLETLLKLRSLLKPKSYLLIRIPIAGSYYQRRYGSNWAALDAPRHLYLHTRESLNLLATQAGFVVSEVVFDSDGFTHWASEQYVAGISFEDPRSYSVNPNNSIFKKDDIDGFAELAAQLNDKGESDCAAFVLRA